MEPANRLAAESSPYLRQHAANPVDWFPWGEPAFARARELDRPLFVSIGYSTCHWCHVMEHESFSDPRIASLMNAHLVCVKIDREERPDLDAHFMHHCQMLTGAGGWPLTVVLTPGGRVWFAGTYFPPTSRHGRIGMDELVPRLSRAWHEQRAQVLDSAGRIHERLCHDLESRAGEPAPGTLAGEARLTLARRYDSQWGGFSPAPRFPTPQHLQLLLQDREDGAALAMVEHTLQEMRRGGLWDQVGQGFHRYSTDREWTVPHFEKMLYDQALLVPVYLEAWRRTGRPVYHSVVEQLCGFVIRELGLPGGGFASALDADAEGEEGKFHTWRHSELDEVLSPDERAVFDRLWPLPAGGNWRGESGREQGLLVLRRPGGPGHPLEDHAHGSEQGDREARVLAARLFALRAGRPAPFRDDKVLLDWNALMVSALAETAFALGRADLLELAGATLDSLLERLALPDGRLLRCLHEGRTTIPALLLDHAALVSALLELYTAGGEPRHLDLALRFQHLQEQRFLDPESGAWFTVPAEPVDRADPQELLRLRREGQDGALPSGNALTLQNLVRLGRLTGDGRWITQAEGLAAWAHANLPLAANAADRLLCALDELRLPRRELVLAGDPRSPAWADLLAVIRARWIPGQILHRLPIAPGSPVQPAGLRTLCTLAPWLSGLLPAKDSRSDGPPRSAIVYNCRDHHCQAPCTTPEALDAQLGAP